MNQTNNNVLTLNTEEEMLLPKMAKRPENETKKQHLFSKALFRESFKSNKKSLFIVSAANTFLMMLVIFILSTLSINATSNAMSNMFSSSNSESSIKTAAITYYAAYSSSATTFTELDSSLDTLEMTLEESANLMEDSSTKDSINTLQPIYLATYTLASGDSDTKHSTAKNTVLTLLDNTLSSDTSLSDQEKDLSRNLVSSYFDVYHENSMNNETTAYTTLIREAIPDAFASTIVTYNNVDESNTEDIEAIFADNLSRILDNSISKEVASTFSSFSLALVLSEDQSDYETIENIITSIQTSFSSNQESYLQNTSYRNSVFSSAVIDEIYASLEEEAYYNYLPDFDVMYKTSDLGWPITYIATGEVDENGEAIKTMVELKSYDPDKFIEVDGGLGTPANRAQKMRKKALTGEDYTSEEISAAKEEAQADLVQIKEVLQDFMDAFLTRDASNSNAYYDGSEVLDSAIVSKAIEEVKESAIEEMIKTYNEENGTNITSVSQITGEDGTTTGQESVNMIYNYASSAISSYKTIYEEKTNTGYTSSDARLVAITTASSSTMSQLPTSVYDSLVEMGEMNSYGIVVGMIGFAIAGLLIPMTYIIMLSNSLVAQKVENGSLAFTFSTPTKRNTYIFTQEVYMLFTTTVMALCVLVGTILARQIGIAAGATDFETSLTISQLCMFTFGNYLVTVALSSICFFASSLFNKTSLSIGLGGGISVFCFICAILGIFGSEAIPGTARIDAMNVFNYLTIFTFFDAHAVLVDDSIYWVKLIALVAIALLFNALSMKVFKEKDLPL